MSLSVFLLYFREKLEGEGEFEVVGDISECHPAEDEASASTNGISSSGQETFSLGSRQ